jgi:hypothetical protein
MAADEQLRHAHKIGWRESCLLDIVSLRAAAPVPGGTSRVRRRAMAAGE